MLRLWLVDCFPVNRVLTMERALQSLVFLAAATGLLRAVPRPVSRFRRGLSSAAVSCRRTISAVSEPAARRLPASGLPKSKSGLPESEPESESERTPISRSAGSASRALSVMNGDVSVLRGDSADWSAAVLNCAFDGGRFDLRSAGRPRGTGTRWRKLSRYRR